MATQAPKTERKKLVSTEVVKTPSGGETLVWHEAATEAEIARLDLVAFAGGTKVFTAMSEGARKAMTYGLKQVAADGVSSIPASERISAIKRNVATLGAGGWPTKASQPKIVSIDTSLDVILQNLQKTNPATTLADVKRMLGLK